MDGWRLDIWQKHANMLDGFWTLMVQHDLRNGLEMMEAHELQKFLGVCKLMVGFSGVVPVLHTQLPCCGRCGRERVRCSQLRIPQSYDILPPYGLQQWTHPIHKPAFHHFGVFSCDSSWLFLEYVWYPNHVIWNHFGVLPWQEPRVVDRIVHPRCGNLLGFCS